METLLPVAASSATWEWQGQQREVRLPNGTTCTSKIAIAVGQRGVCFEDSSSELECTGSVYTHDFGSTFVKTGLRDVDQVSLSATTGTSDDDLCVHAGTTLTCFGANVWGQLGTGATDPVPDPIAWGGRHDVVAFGIGTWNDVCVLDQRGSIDCAGVVYGSTPIQFDQSVGHTYFWMTPGDDVLAEDTSVLRADQSRTECKLTTLGLQCTSASSAPFGTPGAIVMGGGTYPFTSFSTPAFIGASACWLESTGNVYCGFAGGIIPPKEGRMQVFPGRPALALATQFYSNQICAVFADGSVDCVRVTIDTATTTAGPSAPPGSAMIGCP